MAERTKHIKFRVYCPRRNATRALFEMKLRIASATQRNKHSGSGRRSIELEVPSVLLLYVTKCEQNVEQEIIEANRKVPRFLSVSHVQLRKNLIARLRVKSFISMLDCSSCPLSIQSSDDSLFIAWLIYGLKQDANAICFFMHKQ